MQQYLLYFFRNIKRSGLVNEVVQPVGVDERGMRPPLEHRLLRGVVVREVVSGNLRVQTLFKVALVLQSQGVRVVLGMPCYEELAAVLAANGIHARLVGNRHHLELRHLLDVLAANLGMA